MAEFQGTPDHFRLHTQVADALDRLDHRHVWLRLSVVGGRPASREGLQRAVLEVDAWLNSIKAFDFDVGLPRPEHTALGDSFQVVVQAYKRAEQFQLNEFPLVGNPTPWAGYYTS